MVHSREGGKGGLGDTPQKIFSHAISLKKHLFEHRDQPRVHEKGFVNERAKMKESRQNYREIRVPDDNLTENTNARFPLTFQNLL